MAKAVIHAGLPKTGTSTIQDVLSKSRKDLLSEGVLYPFDTPNPNTPLGTICRDDPGLQIGNRGLGPDELQERKREYLGNLEAEVGRNDWRTLLLSGEVLSNLALREILRLSKWSEQYASEWKVLVCVRHPVAWAASVVQQLLKGGVPLERLQANPPRAGFEVRISRLISAFGRDSVEVFDFESALKSEGGVVGEFGRRAGLAAWPDLAERAVRKNESLSMESALLLDEINCGGRVPSRDDLTRAQRMPGERFSLPKEAAKRIAEASRDDVKWLNATFGLDFYGDISA